MPPRRSRGLRAAKREHRDALKDLQNEVNMRHPDEIPAAAERERLAHDQLVRAKGRERPEG